ncbi:hypothetical protein [Sediminicurvatus halobius]|uniref:hypothetical protein n=1 Tax=Sediminicurvatus halobius TaxID=2182432 RepID=UPI0011B29313|nr:hypothetical protein [Spiribacter halobius]UEX79472.1 hypothetical protein LMH63_07460 [Spiribacter halobius]
MRHDNTHKKFRRWPPRVKRRRHEPAERAPDAGAPAPAGRESPADPPEEPQGRSRPVAGRDVKVSFRHRRRSVSQPET